MFRLPDDGRVVLSASDLALAARCELAFARELDIVLGRAPRAAAPDDPMLERVVELGASHEQAELRRLSRAHPGRVAQVARPRHTREGLTDAQDATLVAMASGAEVVYQAALFDGGFVGFADFLERTDAGWLVCDTKLARRESVPALLQVAAYADLLVAAGVRVAPVVRLLLGSGVHEDVRVDEVVPVYRQRRRRLEALLADGLGRSAPVPWGDPEVMACGRCEVCEAEVERAGDLLLVAGMRMPTRARLHAAGLHTLADLAARTEPVDGVRDTLLDRLRGQARLQLEQRPGEPLRHEVVDPDHLGTMPVPSPGDIFFDFEGDPLWVEPGDTSGRERVWGLEYLFGVVEVDSGAEEFRAFWAHDRLQERQALVDFVAYLTKRRERWPDLHVYHYAPYEPNALLRLAARHSVCEDDVDQLLREGVFVDLYAVVRAAIRVSDRSYSLKRLEPLYMEAREGAVTQADQSIVVYHQFRAALDAGQRERADELLGEIRDYNRDDCVSTRLLRDWLLAQGPGAGTRVPTAEGDVVAPAPTAKRLALMAVEESLHATLEGVRRAERTPEQAVVALIASSVLFHAREDKPKWQHYFERLRVPVREWRADDGVFTVHAAEVVREWGTTSASQRKPRRTLRVTGEPLGTTGLVAAASVRALYSSPVPAGLSLGAGQLHCPSPAGVTVEAVEREWTEHGRLRQTLLLCELAPAAGGHAELPVAVVAMDSVGTDSLDAALAEVAEEVRATYPSVPARAAVDVLLRRPPRLRAGGPLPTVGSGPGRHIDAITDALLGMDDSYVAVQGPPGTGKTYVGGRVIARLVREHGWRVGVCSQSHKAIEHMLRSVVAAGVPAEQVAKATRDTSEPPWTHLAKADEIPRFMGSVPEGAGCVVGATAWDLTHLKRFGRGELDLVVIDEAGQYSLAKTLAASVAGARLLLLGDPAQLPQVTTGTHPEPIDTSALGWLLPTDARDGHTLPASHGYFLERTFRLHPALVAPVSALAYDGELRAEPGVAEGRALAGIEPGLHLRLVDHHDNSTASVEEAAAVVELVRDHLGREWHDPDEVDTETALPRGPRPLEQGDIIVTTPYNHQVHTIRAALDDAGFEEVPVGTVDKFQGQEAAVAIVSFAASSHTDVSRGMGFLLDRGRLNVAVSRGKWAAYLVRSAVLTDFAPRTPGELVALGSFLALCEAAHREGSPPGPASDPVWAAGADVPELTDTLF